MTSKSRRKRASFVERMQGLVNRPFLKKEKASYEQKLAQDPNDPELLFRLAGVEAQLEELESAKKLYCKAGKAFERKDALEEAASMYREALALDGHYAFALFRLAELLVRVEEHQEALALFFQLATFFEQEEEIQKSIGVLKRMLEVEPLHGAARDKLVSLFLKKNNRDAAMDQLLMVLPKLKAEKRWDDFVAFGERLIELSPYHVSTLKGLGMVYYRFGHLDQAKEKLEQLDRLRQDDVEVLDLLVACYEQTGESSKKVEVLWNKISLCKRKNLEVELQSIYEEILELAPEDTKARDALNRIKVKQEKLTAFSSHDRLPAAPGSTGEAYRRLLLHDSEVKKIIATIQKLWKKGSIQEALQVLYSALPEAPHNKELRMLHISLLKAQGAYDDAARELFFMAHSTNNLSEAVQYLEQITGMQGLSGAQMEKAQAVLRQVREDMQAGRRTTALTPSQEDLSAILSGSTASNSFAFYLD